MLGIIWKALLGVWDSGPSGFHSGEILYLLFFVYAYVSVMLLRMGKRLGLVLFTISFIISGAMAAVEQFNNLSRLDTTWGFYLLIVGSLLALMWYRDRAYFT